MAVLAPAVNICIPASRKEEWQRGEHKPSPRTLLRSYIQLLCVHSMDQNSITWPHLAVKAGREKIFILNRYAPNYGKGSSLPQDWVYQLEQYWPFGQDTSLLNEAVSTFQDIYTSRPQTHLHASSIQCQSLYQPNAPTHLGGSISLPF